MQNLSSTYLYKVHHMWNRGEAYTLTVPASWWEYKQKQQKDPTLKNSPEEESSP